MADDDRSIRVRLQAEIGNYVDGLKKASLETATFAKNVTGHGNAVKADIEKVGHTTLLMSAGVTAGLALAANAAINWESAWAGVTKTVDGSTAQMAELEEELRNLTNELPATHGEIAAVAEAAGALGIQRGAIVDFTRTMIDLGETTNLTADQAATSMARIANVMQTPQTNFDRLGSTLVALGNAGASTESEILELSQRLAAAGTIAGLTEADVLSFGSALSSAGIEAEAGGTAMSKVFTTVSDAVKDGGDKLTIFGRTASLTAEQFKAAYEKDAAGAIAQFVTGLGDMIERGESLTPVLEALEFTDIRLANALKSTATSGELLNQQLDLGRKAWEENTALAAEAEKRYDTFAAKAEIARNQLVDLGIDVGNNLLPVLSEMLEVGSNVVRGLGEFEGAAGVAATGLGGLAAVGLGAIGVIGTFGPKVKEFHDSLKNLGGIGPTLASNLGKATAALGAVGIAVGVYSFVLGKNEARKQEAIDLSKEYADAIREETGALNENIDAITARKLGEFSGSDRLRDLGADFDVLLTGIRETGDALSDLSSGFNTGQSVVEFAKELDAAGLAGTEFGNELQRLHDEMGSNEFDKFLRLLGELGVGYSDGAVLAANLEAAESGVADAAEGASRHHGTLADNLGLTADESKRAKDEFQQLQDAYRASIDPLFGMLSALEANRKAQGAQAEAAKEGAKRVAEASKDVADAEADLRDARGEKDNAEGIAAAEERLADARERLGEVQADAAISAEELAAMNQAAAESALDVEVAARTLEAAIADGTVSVDGAKSMLREWVDQGLITEEQAYLMGAAFDNARGKAEDLAGDYVLEFYDNAAETAGAIDRVTAALARMNEQIRLNPYSADVTQAEKFVVRAVAEAKGAATGGVVGPMLGPPQASDTIPMRLTPGEGVVNLRGMSMLGPSGLADLNAGMLTPALSAAGADQRSYDNSRTWAPVFHVAEGGREAAGEVEYRLRVMAAMS